MTISYAWSLMFILLSYAAFAYGHPVLGSLYATMAVLAVKMVQSLKKDTKGYAIIGFLGYSTTALAALVAGAVTLAVPPKVAKVLGTAVACLLCTTVSLRITKSGPPHVLVSQKFRQSPTPATA